MLPCGGQWEQRMRKAGDEEQASAAEGERRTPRRIFMYRFPLPGLALPRLTARLAVSATGGLLAVSGSPPPASAEPSSGTRAVGSSAWTWPES